MRLQGKVALVTAAAGPMGRAVALRFAEEGASLIISDISGSRLADAEAAVAQRLVPGAGVFGQRANLVRREEAGQLVRQGVEKLGRVDILVNVVGGIAAKAMFEPMVGLDEARWDATMDLNLKPNFHPCQFVVPDMLERRYGKIVNVSSINYAGEVGTADYSAAKAGVVALTRTMAMEFAPHVNANCIVPGLIRTTAMERMSAEERAFYAQKSLLKRTGEPIDIANAALFLSSDEASYITGQILAVSGGIWPALG